MKRMSEPRWEERQQMIEYEKDLYTILDNFEGDDVQFKVNAWGSKDVSIEVWPTSLDDGLTAKRINEVRRLLDTIFESNKKDWGKKISPYNGTITWEKWVWPVAEPRVSTIGFEVHGAKVPRNCKLEKIIETKEMTRFVMTCGK